jgi:protein SCO1/2
MTRMGSALKRVVRGLPVLAIVAGLIAPGPSHIAAAQEVVQQRVNRSQAGWPLSDFALTDHEGKRLTRAQLQKHWSFIVFGDTHCGTPCTDALEALEGLLQRIAPTAAVKTVQVIFVSLDPARDTPTLLRDYVLAFDNRFIGATGPTETLRSLLDDTGAADSFPAQPPNESKRQQDDRGSSYHGSMVLIGPDGVVRAEYLPPFDVKRLTAEFLITRLRH